VELCDAIIARKYANLNFVVQADCISMSQNEEMVRKMAQAGIKTVFLGIENVSQQNLAAAHKRNTVSASQKAVEMCHKYGIMVIGGLIFGFPDDDEQAIIDNYEFLKTVDADAAYCQILTPYPKTEMRRQLIEQGLVTNPTDYKRYSGLWANVRTRHLDPERLQYFFWYYRQTVLGWWNPSNRVRSQGKGWTATWRYVFKPILKAYFGYILRSQGWQGRYERNMAKWSRMNHFADLDDI
jgi:anaerobic magnesium-protoporphyrin IX monomethyl ester cyclase